MNTGIEIVQIPVIKQNLAFMGEQVTERLNALNIDKQIATTDTVKSLKELRAELNKELADFEAQRKFVKESVLKPYSDFEDLYKTQISEKYKSAIDTLKDKIAIVEDEIKREKKASIMSYFSELCTAEGIDFLKFENVGLEINLSTSEKAYREKVDEYVNRVKDDLALIDTQTDSKAEILVEYRKELNASRAIKTVMDRKERERQEQERLRLIKIETRKAKLVLLEMKYIPFTNSYEYDQHIYMSVHDLENLSDKDFSNKLIQLDEKIKAKTREEAEKLYRQQQEQQASGAAPVEEPFLAEPLQAPVAMQAPQPEATVVAEFRVNTTREKIYLLRDFLINNQINYTNI